MNEKRYYNASQICPFVNCCLNMFFKRLNSFYIFRKSMNYPIIHGEYLLYLFIVFTFNKAIHLLLNYKVYVRLVYQHNIIE